MKYIIQFIALVLMVFIPLYADDGVPFGYEELSQESFKEATEESRYVAVVTSNYNLCSTCPKISNEVNEVEDACKKLRSKIKNELPLLFLGAQSHSTSSEVIGSGNMSSLSAKLSSNFVSIGVIDTVKNQVVLSGGVYPKDNDKSSVKRDSVDSFATELKELLESGPVTKVNVKTEDVDQIEMVDVKSKSGKALSIIPKRIEEDTLSYLFDRKMHSIDLNKLSDDSIEEVKEYLAKNK